MEETVLRVLLFHFLFFGLFESRFEVENLELFAFETNAQLVILVFELLYLFACLE